MRAEELPLILERLQDAAATNQQSPPRLWDTNLPWSAVFLEASENRAYWEEHVIIPANRWIARGCPGAAESNAPDLQLARALLPGGQGRNLGPGGSDHKGRSPTKRERSSSSRGGRGRGKKRRGPKKTKGQKRRAANDRAEKDTQRQAKQPPTKDTGNSSKGKGKSDQVCFAFSKGYGPCANAKPGSTCKDGRKHVCHVCGGNHSAKSKRCKEKG